MKSYAGANTLELCQCEIGTVQLTFDAVLAVRSRAPS